MSRIAGFFIALLLALPWPVSAQPPVAGGLWQHGTTVNIFGGVAAGSSTTGASGGGAFGWEITPAFAIEASGSWLDRGSRASAFAADLTAQVGLTRPSVAVPFVEAGIGFYRASFDAGAPDVPGFYRLRMGSDPAAALSRETFTDPSFVFGGGMNLYVSRHFAIRPNVNAILVRRHGDQHVVTSFTVHLAYHFEQHPLMPDAGSRR